MANPHDHLFKGTFGEPKEAARYFERFLPAEIVGALDLAKAQRRSGSFVDEALKERESDLLYAVPFHEAAGRAPGTALLYILFEHQSTCDRWMALRLLGYLVRIWESWLAENRGAGRLPPILPAVLYHGATEWTAARQFSDLIEVPAPAVGALRRHLPQFEYLLTDLSRHSDEDLRAGALYAVVLLFFKHIRDWDLDRRLSEWADLFDRVAEADLPGLRAIRMLIEYLVQAGEVAPEALRKLAAKTGSKVGGVIMSTAEMLRQEGRAEGEARGRAEGLREACRLALAAKMANLPPNLLEILEAIGDPGALAELLRELTLAKDGESARAAVVRRRRAL